MTALSFPAWIEFVFSRPVPVHGLRWYHEPDSPLWLAEPAEKLDYLTRLFRQPRPVLDDFADSQLAQGLWYLIDSGGGDHADALRDPAVDLAVRLDFLRSIGDLFAQLFQPKCVPMLSHLDRQGEYPLNMICYMWWDIFPGCVSDLNDPARTVLDRVCLDVMAATLRLGNIACQEAALHGLGHWQFSKVEGVSAIVDAYLAYAMAIPPDLQRYANSARCGCVL